MSVAASGDAGDPTMTAPAAVRSPTSTRTTPTGRSHPRRHLGDRQRVLAQLDDAPRLGRAAGVELVGQDTGSYLALERDRGAARPSSDPA